MIRGEYEDRSVFVDRDGAWRPVRGGSDGAIEPVPAPWFDRFLLRWLPHLALQRAQARVALEQLAAQRDQYPSGITVQRWSPPPASVLRDRRW